MRAYVLRTAAAVTSAALTVSVNAGGNHLKGENI